MATLGQPGVTLPPIPANISAIVGPAWLGTIVNWFLYGIVVMQMYVYYQWFPNDKKKIKTLVYVLFILDSLQTIMGTSDGFQWFASGFGNMNVLTDPHLSGFDAPILDGMIAFIVQTFFCWRIQVLMKSWWLPIIIFGVSLSGLAGAMALGITTLIVKNLSKLSAFKWQFSLWLAGSALADTMIAMVMTWVLLRSRSKNFTQTNNVLVKIVRLTVETNVVTASLAIVSLVVLLAIPQDPNITMTPGFALGKSYTNTLLAILNNRVYMKRGMAPLTTSGSNFRVPTSQQRDASNTAVHVGSTRVDDEYTLEIQVHKNVDTKISPI